MLDHLLKGPTIVDGSGRARRRSDIGIAGGKIATVDPCSEPARQTIECSDLVVTPGFIDVHTHYDSQLLWDPYASPSLLHGTTTVIAGNCGFSIAPLKREDDYVARMMARVEGIPLLAIEAGPRWEWEGFNAFLDAVADGLAINAGFLVGHSAVRRAVLGDEIERSAVTKAELDAMATVVEQALASGALGFSTSRADTHTDGDGRPVPSRFASREEVVALSAVLRSFPGANLQTIPDNIIAMSDADAALMVEMADASGASVNWNLLKVSSAHPEAHVHQLRASDEARRRGARVIALALPQLNALYVTLASGFLFDALPGWTEVMALSRRERMAALADPLFREQLRRGAAKVAGEHARGSAAMLALWEDLQVAEVTTRRHASLAGRTLGSIGREQRKDPFDVMLDLALDESLETGFSVPPQDDDDASWSLRAEAWRDTRTLLGGSDAGAHVDLMCGATYTTSLLADSVRGRRLLTLEEAVHQLAAVPADLYHLSSRGRIAPGYAADLVAFDPERVGAEPMQMVDDLPGGAHRLSAESRGVEHVFVNGVEVVRDGAHLDRRPGELLRLR